MVTNSKLGTDLAGLDLVATYQGDLALVEGKDNVRAALFRRLNTPLGGLFAHPEYGNPVYDILSEPMDEAWSGKAAARVRQCCEQEPRIKVESVTVAIDLENRLAAFAVSYEVLDEPGADNLVWQVNVS